MGQSANRRFRVAPCGADLFADPVAGFVYPAIEALEVTAAIKDYPRPFLSSDHDHFPHALGEKEAAIKFSTEGRGFGGSPAGAGSAVAASDGENGLLLKSVFGSQVKDTGSVCASGTTASLIKVASTAALSVGNFVGVVDPGTGLYYARQVRSKTATDLTLDRILPFTPAIGATVYASATYSHAVSGHQHLWFDAEGYDATPANGWRRYVRGALGTLALKNTGANGRLMFDWDFKGIDWSDAGQGSSQGAPTYPANLPSQGGFIRSTRLSIGATALVVSDLGYELGNELDGKPSTQATQGVASMLVKDAKQILTFKVEAADAEAATLRTKWQAKTTLDLLVELTQGGPGNGFAIAAPVAQIIDFKPGTANGLDYFEVTCACLASGITGVPAVAFGVL